MNTVIAKDGTNIFYKDWGEGRPIVFSHGWPLNADAWDEQLAFFASSGYRAIAHDRRGHGRSSQAWLGNDMDTYASDLADLLETLELSGVVLVGHSTGGGEVTRYLGRYGSQRVAKAALVSAIGPRMLKTEAHPLGLAKSFFDEMRARLAADRSEFLKELSAPFYGANSPGSSVSPGLRDQFWLYGMQANFKAVYDCVDVFSETDLTEDLKQIDVPTWIVHGEDDQIVPIAASAHLSSKIVKDAALKVYPGAPHGLTATHRRKLNADLLAFVQG